MGALCFPNNLEMTLFQAIQVIFGSCVGGDDVFTMKSENNAAAKQPSPTSSKDAGSTMGPMRNVQIKRGDRQL